MLDTGRAVFLRRPSHRSSECPTPEAVTNDRGVEIAPEKCLAVSAVHGSKNLTRVACLIQSRKHSGHAPRAALEKLGKYRGSHQWAGLSTCIRAQCARLNTGHRSLRPASGARTGAVRAAPTLRRAQLHLGHRFSTMPERFRTWTDRHQILN